MNDFTKEPFSAYNNALKEAKRTAADDSWDVWSNYYFCPQLCEDCKFFSKINGNWPFHCKSGTNQAASHKSKKDGYKQYDNCLGYE